jgi:hypothetical protein
VNDIASLPEEAQRTIRAIVDAFLANYSEQISPPH